MAELVTTENRLIIILTALGVSLFAVMALV